MRPGSKVVMQGTANPLYVGSIPTPGTSGFLQIAATPPQTFSIKPTQRIVCLVRVAWPIVELWRNKSNCNA